MQKLINEWRRKACINSKAAKKYDSAEHYFRAQILRQCTSELSRINTFKFAVGDEVTVIETGYVGTIKGRAEHLQDKKLLRFYTLDGMFQHYENELQHHRPNQGQTRPSPRGRAK